MTRRSRPARSILFALAAFAASAVAACGSEVDDKTGTVMDGVLDPASVTFTPELMNCNSTDASSGATCNGTCITQCGFERMGTKVCTCLSGVFSQCPCFKPPTFLGAAEAPLCTTPDGTTSSLDGTPCPTLWEECIGTDPVTGATPRGCVCVDLVWSCGSTNRWFKLEGT